MIRITINEKTIQIINAITQLAILKQPININRIVKITGISRQTVSKYLKTDLNIMEIY